MKNQFAASLLAAAAIAGPTLADGVPSRHFTQSPTDTNRSERIVYAPLGMKVIGQRTINQPYDVSAATWYLKSPGAQGARPDKVLDKGAYTLDSFELLSPRSASQGPRFKVVITRRPAPATEDMPEVHVVHPQSGITVRGFPQIETVADGVRYSYLITPPPFGFFPTGDFKSAASGQYEIRFMTARDVRPPASIARLPTFGGEDHSIRSTTPPPRLPAAERVAGKRIEYRNGEVVDEKKK